MTLLNTTESKKINKVIESTTKEEELVHDNDTDDIGNVS